MASINVKAGKADQVEHITADLDQIKQHDDLVNYLLEYAISVQAQRDGAGTDPADAIRRTKARIEGYHNGQLPSRGGGGGAGLDEETKAQRELVEDRLRKLGWKATEARKTAKQPQDAFRLVLQAALADRDGVAVSKVKKADIDAAFEKNWPATAEQAAKIAKERKQGATGDLNLATD